nr:hypothetical protein Iba_chr10eCG12160 [Ipomoea batatas]
MCKSRSEMVASPCDVTKHFAKVAEYVLSPFPVAFGERKLAVKLQVAESKLEMEEGRIRASNCFRDFWESSSVSEMRVSWLASQILGTITAKGTTNITSSSLGSSTPRGSFVFCFLERDRVSDSASSSSLLSSSILTNGGGSTFVVRVAVVASSSGVSRGSRDEDIMTSGLTGFFQGSAFLFSGAFLFFFSSVGSFEDSGALEVEAPFMIGLDTPFSIEDLDFVFFFGSEDEVIAPISSAHLLS